MDSINDFFPPEKKLGFGLMRLPTKNEKIDIEQITEMVALFLDRGYSYYDTAPGYMNGLSEVIFGNITHGIYNRSCFSIATKMPAWDSRITSKNVAELWFWNSLKNLQVDYLDYYLFHNMGEERSQYFDKYDLWNFIMKRKNDGYIKHFGVSFHDKADQLEMLLKEHAEIEFVQLQINYMDWTNPFVESQKCYEIARKYNKPIVVMEPLKGGILAAPILEITQMVQTSHYDDPISFAFDFIKALPQCKVILSGMSSIEQMKDNIEKMEKSTSFSDVDWKIVERLGDLRELLNFVDCTSCKYCVASCPANIVINEIINALYLENTYKNHNAAFNKYVFQTRDGRKASQCLGCGKCENVCPQHIEIRKYLKSAVELFE